MCSVNDQIWIRNTVINLWNKHKHCSQRKIEAAYRKKSGNIQGYGALCLVWGKWMTDWKKYDCLVTLSCCWKQNSHPKQVQVYQYLFIYLLIWFRIYFGKVYHLQVHCCFGSLKTEYNNSANQVHLWFEK